MSQLPFNRQADLLQEKNRELNGMRRNRREITLQTYHHEYQMNEAEYQQFKSQIINCSFEEYKEYCNQSNESNRLFLLHYG